MKPVTLILAVSIAGNAALVGFYFWKPPPLPVAAAKTDRVPRVTVAVKAKEAEAAAKAAAAEELARKQAEWKAANTGDLKELVSRLREAGLSPSLMSSIVYLEVSAQYAGRMMEIFGLTGETPPFWKNSGDFLSVLNDPQRSAANTALNLEINERVRELMGDDYLTQRVNPESMVFLRQQYGDLSAERMLGLIKIQDENSRKMTAVRAGTVGAMLPEEREKMTQLQKDLKTEIAAFLTPAELEDYELRSSYNLKASLTAFGPTEEEYRTMFRVQKAFEEKYPVATAEQAKERTNNIQDLRDGIAAVLPQERAAEYRLSAQEGAGTLTRIVERLSLPKEKLGEALRAQQDIQARAKQIQADASLNPNTRSQQLAGLAAEATSRITAAIGPKGMDAYKQNGGAWLKNMTK